MSGFTAEIIGTAVLILLGDGVVAGVLLKDSKAQNSGWIVITLAWGLAVLMGIYASGNYSGAHLNPAVSVGLALAGKFAWANVPQWVAGQMIGGFIGAVLVWLMYLPHWEKTQDKDLKLATFCTSPAISHTFGKSFDTIKDFKH